MKTFLFLSLATSWILMAQDALLTTTGWADWDSATAMGILAVVVVTLVTKTLPEMSRRNNETLERITNQFAATVTTAFDRIERWQAQVHEDSQRLNETLRAMIAYRDGTIHKREGA